MLWLCALVQKHCVEQTEADLIVHSGREQTGIVQFVDTFPHFEGHAPLPPSGVLVFVDDATLQIQEQAQSERTVGPPEFSPFFGAFEYPFIVQFHGEVPIETAIFGVVACSEVLPDTIVPGFGY